MDLGASVIAVLFLLVVVVVVVVRNNDSADVGNYTEKEEDIHPDKTGNNVVVAAFVVENMSVVDDVVTLLASAIAWASAALRLEIVALVDMAEVVAVEVHDYYRPRRCMAIVVKAVEVCHDLSC
jgi:hypothetical protein